ncbi:MAG: di-trans,poly-cis-decaprenylcistransferase [Alphaproteobacteria bacterium]|nr:di-trans,poly-cis-decaprenylcistransferase [Alphaproteobacteria bacterium]MCD8570090.1 di-trans,poly-cis-decaprenylcistransferase [Alphaproteobacteria bacterium]
MDGNGRWAQARGLPRTMGHKSGAEAARRVTRAAAELGIEYLTLFGFSSENWNRPQAEVSELMKLLRYYLRSETAELHKNNIRLRVVGERAAFDADIVELIQNAEKLTAENAALTVMIALNYGGRADIVQAAQKLSSMAVERGRAFTKEEITALMDNTLLTAGAPDPDLLIRTSGEKRISNFLLWQCAYAEFVFTNTLWPDFDKADLESAMAEFSGRDRRYGAIQESKA